MSESPDVIGFSVYKNPEGEQRYACRGIGPRYNEFCAWLNTKQYETTSDDWPWTGWKFLNPKHEGEFIAKYDVEGTYFDKEHN